MTVTSYFIFSIFILISPPTKAKPNYATTSNEPLILTPLIEQGKTKEARRAAEVDSQMFFGINSYSAFITVNKTSNSNLYFWFFPAQNSTLGPEETPWLIWLQGGPGASSLYGLFAEIGPLEILNEGGNVKARRMPVTWNANYSLLFIDNPVGTGFSHGDLSGYCTNEDMVGSGLYVFIQQFLQVFPELRKAPLFIGGESYGGKYIPALGYYIHRNRDQSQPINLRGLAIGDGWTDPPNFLHSADFLLQLGFISPEQADAVRLREAKAREYYKEGNIKAYAKEFARIYSTLSVYRMTDDYNYLKYDDSFSDDNLTFYVTRNEIRGALHVGMADYKVFDDKVYQYLQDDFYLSSIHWLEELVEHYGVLCYSGQLDVIVAYPLSVQMYRNMKWSGSEKYLKAKRVPIRDANNLTIGYEKSYGNFKEVMIRNAGHMVPRDQPNASLQMITSFIDKYRN